MTRSFPIPVAAVGMTGCGGFPFVGDWNLDRAIAGYTDEPGSEQTQDFPLVYDEVTYEVSASIEKDGTLTLTRRTVYAYGAPDDLYTDGPYDWERVDSARIEVTGDFDADRFVCDGDVPTDGAMACTLEFDDDGRTFAVRYEFLE